MSEKKTIYSYGAALAFGLLLLVLLTAAPAAATTWDVNPGDDFKSIVDNADAGDTVFVHPGAYNTSGALTIDKSNLTIMGEDEETTIIDAQGQNIKIGEYSASPNCTLEHLQIINECGLIFQSGSDNGLVKNCIIKCAGTDKTAALYFHSSNCTAENNIIDGGYYVANYDAASGPFTFRNNTIANTTASYAVRVSTTAQVLIEDNTIQKSCGGGIVIYYGANATIVGNTVSSQGKGMWAYKPTGPSAIYGNEFLDNDGGNVVATTPVVEQNWTSPEEIAYIYNGTSHTGYIGNYYSDYTGTDSDGDGIGDTPYELSDGLGNDTAPLVATLDNYDFSGEAAEPVGLSFSPATAETGVGGTTEVSIVVDSLPAGLSGYNLTVSLDDPAVANITGVNVPTWASINATGTLPSGSVWIKAADLGESISAGAANVTLATLTLTGLSSGSANITATVTRMDGDDGSAIGADVVDGRVLVSSAATVPGCENPPCDLDGDGICDDVNGNGLFDFDDVVTFFTSIEWMAGNEPTEAFDFNGNSRIEFADLVGLYKKL